MWKNKTIKNIELKNENTLYIHFIDGEYLTVKDEGQSCCESRYMTLDGDDLTPYYGAQLLDVKVLDGPDIGEEYESHEQQFLHIETSKGVFVVSAHNEHNGYYGGFSIVLEESH